MATATVTVKWTGNPPCGSSSPPYVGESYYLYLDQSLFQVDVTSPILGTFQSEGPGGSNYDKTYTFSYDDTLTPDGVTELEGCHIKDIACLDSCCAELTRRINEIEVGPGIHVVSGLHVVVEELIRLTMSDASTVDIDISPVILSVGASEGDYAVTSAFNLGERLQVWSAGGIDLNITGGGPNLNIEPANISAQTDVASIAGIPADDTRPMIHFASDGMYFWDPRLGLWFKQTSSRVLSGNGPPFGFTPSQIDPAAIDTNPAVYWDFAGNNGYHWDLDSVSWIPDAYRANSSYGPVSLADGSGVNAPAIPLAEAKIGDFVQVSFSNPVPEYVSMTGQVLSDGFVTVRFQNESGGARTIGAGTIKVRLTK